MKKFEVGITQDVTQSCVLEIEADNEEQAKDLAEARINEKDLAFTLDDGNDYYDTSLISFCDEVDEFAAPPPAPSPKVYAVPKPLLKKLLDAAREWYSQCGEYAGNSITKEETADWRKHEKETEAALIEVDNLLADGGPKPKLYIAVRGGLVQGALSEIPLDVEVHDYDNREEEVNAGGEITVMSDAEWEALRAKWHAVY